MQFKDYYKTLGVAPDASTEEIRKAYRKLARKYHPDRNQAAGAEDRFKEVGEAWEALKDEERRQHYDQLRAGGWQAGQSFRPPPGWAGAGAGNQSGFGGFSDFFETLFGGLGGMGGMGGAGGHARQALRGQDIHASLKIDLQTAFAGGKRRLNLDRGGHPQSLEVRIPAGITSGQRIRLAGQGQPGMGGGPAGDLYLEIEISPHSLFQLDGKDVLFELQITPWQAALGAKLRVPTLAGEVSLNVPAGSSSGRRLRLAGRGLPGKPPGDQLVELTVTVPLPASEEERQLYRQLAELAAQKA